MEISSIKPSVDLFQQASPIHPGEAAQRRKLIQAAGSINESGLLGHNQLVFLLDRATHRPIIRVEDRETHEVLLQLPPDYVLRLAEDVKSGSTQITSPMADT